MSEDAWLRVLQDVREEGREQVVARGWAALYVESLKLAWATREEVQGHLPYIFC